MRSVFLVLVLVLAGLAGCDKRIHEARCLPAAAAVTVDSRGSVLQETPPPQPLRQGSPA
jgi:hypothetical protein